MDEEKGDVKKTEVQDKKETLNDDSNSENNDTSGFKEKEDNKIEKNSEKIIKTDLEIEKIIDSKNSDENKQTGEKIEGTDDSKIDSKSEDVLKEFEYSDELKEGIISQNLLSVFEKNDLKISEKTILLKQDKKIWLIKDNEHVYEMEKNQNKIKILNYDKVDQNDVIEKGKPDKLSFEDKLNNKFDKIFGFCKIDKNHKMTDKEEILASTIKHFGILLIIVLIVDMGVKYYTSSDPESLYPLQKIETKIVYKLQRFFDVPVEYAKKGNNTDPLTLRYDNSKIDGLFPNQNIGPECTGFHEIVFLMLLVLGFRYIKWMTKIKWAFILAGIIFVENIFRLFILYFIAVWKGADWEDTFHFYWWHYGQYAVVMSIFILWFWFVARKASDKYFEDLEKEAEKATDT